MFCFVLGFMLRLVRHRFIIIATDFLGRFVSEMTCDVSSGMSNLTDFEFSKLEP